jgi:hypothetical protein
LLFSDGLEKNGVWQLRAAPLFWLWFRKKQDDTFTGTKQSIYHFEIPAKELSPSFKNKGDSHGAGIPFVILCTAAYSAQGVDEPGQA